MKYLYKLSLSSTVAIERKIFVRSKPTAADDYVRLNRETDVSYKNLVGPFFSDLTLCHNLLCRPAKTF